MIRILRAQADLGVDPEDWADTREAPETDDRMRELIDLLPYEQKHMVDRVFFGQCKLEAAGHEIGFGQFRAKRVFAEALATLKGWLSGADVPDKPVESTERPLSGPVSDETCDTYTVWGWCQQRPSEGHLCAMHEEMAYTGIEPALSYQEQVVRGEREPINSRFTGRELKTILSGRPHGDGRRLDSYVTQGDPIWLDMRDLR